MARSIMIQGTMSGAGKSLIAAALCRIFLQDGYKVAPFKSQNMALNSYITSDGLELGRAQAMQAQAAGKEPDVRMNPVLLKPSSDTGSQLIVNGEVRGEYHARDYFKMKKSLIPDILSAYNSLAEENDIIVIEGAGSPAEINLKADDIVNMGMARLVNAPVILVGDIDRGGVFAQLYGTVALLEADERARIVGTVINKFRGDVSLLSSGLDILVEKTGVPVLGVVPYTYADVDDEDSLSPRLGVRSHSKLLDIAVIRFPHISNFTDFSPLERHELLGVRYITKPEEIDLADAVILPGTKNTMADLLWMRESGLESAVKKYASKGGAVLGVCGGYQMLGTKISDPYSVEHGGEMSGIGLLDVETVFETEKCRTRVKAVTKAPGLENAVLDAYEIHMGSTRCGGTLPFALLENGEGEGAVCGSIFGTYLHGLFDTGELTDRLAAFLMARRGTDFAQVMPVSHYEYQEKQLDILADTVRRSLDMSAVYAAMERYSYE